VVCISHPRRQQCRRLASAAAALALGALAGMLAVAAVGDRAGGPAAALGIVAAALVAYARHCVRQARRGGVGARSERQVRRALAPLRAEGWRLRHALSWDGRGDIDHVAIAPRAVGLAFVVETKTRTYTADQLAGTASRARWVASRRRRWGRHGAVPVLCVMRPYGIRRFEDGVLVVSLDRLTAALRDSVGARARPAFLAPAAAHRWTEQGPNGAGQSPTRVAVARSLRVAMRAPVENPGGHSLLVLSERLPAVPRDARSQAKAPAGGAAPPVDIPSPDAWKAQVGGHGLLTVPVPGRWKVTRPGPLVLHA
jgi:hypothetical protein